MKNRLVILFLTILLTSGIVLSCNPNPDTDGDNPVTANPGNEPEEGGTEPVVTGPPEITTLRLTAVTSDAGPAAKFSWVEPPDSDFDHVNITYKSVSGDTESVDVPKGENGTTLKNLIEYEINAITFKAVYSTQESSAGTVANVYVPKARNLDVTYITSSNAANLNAILLSSGYYILDTDIDLSGSEWTPVPGFGGVLFGNGHTISNMTITSGTVDVGFFASLGTSGELCDVCLKDVLISISSNVDRVGSLVADNDGTLVCCAVGGTISTPKGKYVGGMIGFDDLDSRFNKYCYSEVDVTGGNYAGGFAGFIYDAKDCYSIGKVESTGERTNSFTGVIGGFSGYAGSYISRCYSAGNVSPCSGCSDKGGFTGIKKTTVSNSYYNSALAGLDGDAAAADISLTDKNFFSGFDFSSDKPVWDIDSSVNGGMPYLCGNRPE